MSTSFALKNYRGISVVRTTREHLPNEYNKKVPENIGHSLTQDSN